MRTPAAPNVDDAPAARCVAPESHSLGAQALAVVLSGAGWATLLLGASTPPDALLGFIAAHQPELVALSVKSAFNLPTTLALAAEVRGLAQPPAVLVGGAAVRRDILPVTTELAADLLTDDLDTAVRWAEGLLTSHRAPGSPTSDTPQVVNS